MSWYKKYIAKTNCLIGFKGICTSLLGDLALLSIVLLLYELFWCNFTHHNRYNIAIVGMIGFL
jgi:hypothetical protein